MKPSNKTTPVNHRRPRVLLITGLIVVVGVITVGIYGMFFTNTHFVESPVTGPTPAVTPSKTPPSSSGQAPVKDAEVFARWAATTLFTWDTATMNPASITNTLMSVADPTGDGEAPGLASDITNYLPDTQTWATLRSYTTTQQLSIESIAIPEGWEQTKASAADGQLLPGTLAYTITGTRHRDGIWNNQPASYTAPISFTMFITCQPSFPECHLMRLSLPDQPLE